MTTPAVGSSDDEFEISDADYDELEPPESTPNEATPVAEVPPDLPPPDAATAQSDDPQPEGGASPETPPPATEPPTEAPTPTWAPPQGGTPWTLHVDRTAHLVDGAIEYPEGVFIPREFVRPFQQKFVADRNAWQFERQRWQQVLEQTRTDRAAEVNRSRAILEKIAEIDKGGPEAWVQWLDNFAVNRAVLEAEVRAKVAEAEAQRFAQLHEQRRMEEQAKEVTPRLQHHLGSALEAVLGEDKGLLADEEQQELLRFLWDHGDRLYYEAGPHDPTGLREGEIGFREDVFRDLVGREIRRARKYKEDVARLEKVAQRNAAARPPEPQKPKPQPTATAPAERPRDDKGRFAEKPADSRQDYRDWKRRLENESWAELGD